MCCRLYPHLLALFVLVAVSGSALAAPISDISPVEVLYATEDDSSRHSGMSTSGVRWGEYEELLESQDLGWVLDSTYPLLPDSGVGDPLGPLPLFKFSTSASSSSVSVGDKTAGTSAVASPTTLHVTGGKMSDVGYAIAKPSSLTNEWTLEAKRIMEPATAEWDMTTVDEVVERTETVAAAAAKHADRLFRPIPVTPMSLEPRETAPQGAGTAPAAPHDGLTVTPAKAAAAAAALGIATFLPWALYHRVKAHRTLDNATRKRIFDAVIERPGAGVQFVADAAGVSYSTAVYHLDRLVTARMLIVSGQGSKLSYFKNGGSYSESDRALLPILKNKEALRVLDFVRANPETYRAAIADALNVSPTTVNWHLKRLLKTGLVCERREGRSVLLFVDATRHDGDLIPLAARVNGQVNHVEFVANAPVAA